jgi:hypothetical protein
VAGSTIDHMIAVTILIAALLVTMGIYNQMFASAVEYEGNRKVAMKAVDIINTACICPGNPEDWGETKTSLLGFGLQDPEAGGYALSPYSLMRLRTSSNDSELVYYDLTGLFYNNISANYGNNIFSPVGDCLNYTAAAKMLGINGTYGFSLDIVPTLDVNVSQVPNEDYLILKVEVRGPGIALADVTLNYYMFQIVSGEGTCPSITTQNEIVQTSPYGSALIEFPTITDTDTAYSFIVYASLSGLEGVGYYSHDTIEDDPPYILPLIQDFENGTIAIAHTWDVHDFGPPVPNVFYNATFFVLSQGFRLHQVQIPNSTGEVNYGQPPEMIQVPAYEAGVLLITYKGRGQLRSIVLPWGVGTLGVSISFGGDPTGYSFVATELRQVSVNDISYQMKVSTWSLGD